MDVGLQRAGITQSAATLLVLLPSSTSLLEPASPDPIRELQDRFRAAYENEDWPRAIEIGTQLACTLRDEGGSAYNLAGADARSGDATDALSWLESSAAAGFSKSRLLATDADLDSVRREERFTQVTARVEANRLANFEWFTARARKANPLVKLHENYDPANPAPSIVALHGRGTNGRDITRVWREVARQRGALLVAPDALRSFADDLKRRYVDESVWLATQTVTGTIEKHTADDGKILLTGFSQGAYVAMIARPRRLERYCGLVLVSGFSDPEDSTMPSLNQKSSLRVQSLTGSNDPSAPSYRRATETSKPPARAPDFLCNQGSGTRFRAVRGAI